MNNDRHWDTERQEWVYPADWRPIDSAPTDGTIILLWAEGRMVMARNIAHERGDYWGIELSSQEANNPTHWTYLPEPPNE